MRSADTDSMNAKADEMAYHWIDPALVPDLNGKKIILFGAGRGGEEFLRYAKARQFDLAVLAVVDNDQSFWGRSWQGLEVVPPKALPSFAFDQVVVTSISGREAIAGQLLGLGCSEQQILTRDKFYQNRLLPVDWQQLHLEKGFRITKFEVEKHLPISAWEVAGFHERFSHYSTEEASQANPVIVAEKAKWKNGPDLFRFRAKTKKLVPDL